LSSNEGHDAPGPAALAWRSEAAPEVLARVAPRSSGTRRLTEVWYECRRISAPALPSRRFHWTYCDARDQVGPRRRRKARPRRPPRPEVELPGHAGKGTTRARAVTSAVEVSGTTKRSSALFLFRRVGPGRRRAFRLVSPPERVRARLRDVFLLKRLEEGAGPSARWMISALVDARPSRIAFSRVGRDLLAGTRNMKARPRCGSAPPPRCT